MPTSNAPEAVIGSIAGALTHEVLYAFDESEDSETARIQMIFENPQNALWLGVGLRAPMVRAQLAWIIDQLRAQGIGPSSRVLDIGSGCGLTATIIQSILSCEVLGIDPQPGSAAAGEWLNQQLGTTAAFREIYPKDLEETEHATFDAVISQAGLTYMQAKPCRDESPGKAIFTRALNDITPATPDTQALLNAALQSKCLLLLDHDQPSLWAYLASQARSNGLAPDWNTLATHSYLLPLGQNSQISLVFKPGTLSDSDIENLRNATDSSDSHESHQNENLRQENEN